MAQMVTCRGQRASRRPTTDDRRPMIADPWPITTQRVLKKTPFQSLPGVLCAGVLCAFTKVRSGEDITPPTATAGQAPAATSWRFYTWDHPPSSPTYLGPAYRHRCGRYSHANSSFFSAPEGRTITVWGESRDALRSPTPVHVTGLA